jgi:hypothetical protein
MILIAMSISTNDTAGYVTLEFPTQDACEQALATVTYEFDLGIFVNEKDWKLEGTCEKSS